MLTTIAWSLDGKVEYALESSMMMASAVVHSLPDELRITRTVAEVEVVAQSVPKRNLWKNTVDRARSWEQLR